MGDRITIQCVQCNTYKVLTLQDNADSWILLYTSWNQIHCDRVEEYQLRYIVIRASTLVNSDVLDEYQRNDGPVVFRF